VKTAPIRPGRLDFDAAGVPFAPDFGDVFHPAAGALQQARHVFLAGNGLPARWAGRDRFVVLETGFGLGNNFLATWDAWRTDPRRCARLVFVSIEKHPLSRADLARAHAATPLPELAAALRAAWPPSTPNLHPLAFDGGRVQLLLGFGDLEALLRQLVATVDAFYLDGFAPSRNPDMWAEPLLRRLGRLAAPGATAATWSAARGVRDGLAAAGFAVETAPGSGGKRDITLARHVPRHVPAAPPGGLPARPAHAREALIVGAGLAGSAAAWALARLGWHGHVLDRAAAPATAASGNPAGLFHATVHADDGPHARLLRAAALEARRSLAPWLADGRVPGSAGGLLRLESRLDAASARALLEAQGLPAGFVDWLDRPAARAASGLELPSGGWWFGDGGWVAPAALARAMLQEAGAEFRAAQAVATLERRDGRWQALDAAGRVLAEAPVMVLANGIEASRLLGRVPAAGGRALPLRPVRGQISSLAAGPGLPAPRVPVVGGGYVLPPLEGQLLFGATQQHDDPEAALRASDHRHNLAQLARLAGIDTAQAEAWGALPWSGRVGWRAVTPDRLPLIGAVPDAGALADAARADRPRHVPRLRDADGGLYVFAGLGSRGLTWAALGAQLLASWIEGTPSPVEADLRDALDPARFALRAAGG
jgi:tRNA 5-methylaminomethyl-2-thiouridine biosynthesis bifunctional protein